NSAASSAGLTAGDTIVSVDGHAIASTNDLNTAMRSTHVGDKVQVGWTDSAGTSHTASVTLNNGAA
ncbi:MAG: hypothetical protein QOI55_1982, partial [Actinomycetota bacterium]|nr:hypothetical protein [Actinomycetota bacterium]